MGYANIHLLPKEQQDKILGNPPAEEAEEEPEPEEEPKEKARGRPKKIKEEDE